MTANSGVSCSARACRQWLVASAKVAVAAVAIGEIADQKSASSELGAGGAGGAHRAARSLQSLSESIHRQLPSCTLARIMGHGGESADCEPVWAAPGSSRAESIAPAERRDRRDRFVTPHRRPEWLASVERQDTQYAQMARLPT